MRNILSAVVVLSMLVSGCASTWNGGGTGAQWEPVVDVRPEQQARYQTDLWECQAYANRVMSAQAGAVAGAVGGAILGALLGAAAGGNGRFNTRMAGVGAVGGGVTGMAEAEGGQRGIIRRCMMGRGYVVLN